MSDFSRLLTDADAAEFLSCSVDEVRRRCRTGQFPHVRIGRKYRFTAEDMAAIVEAHRKSAKVGADNPWGIRRRGGAA